MGEPGTSEGRRRAPRGTSDTMRGRLSANRTWTWLLLDADRRLVSAGLIGALFASFVLLGTLDPAGIGTAVATGDPVGTTFQAFIAAIVTGVTLVVTINQLVLSQELGAVGDQRERMRGSLEFRAEVESAIDRAPAPAEPAAFLRALLAETQSRVDAVADAAGGADPDRREAVSSFISRLTENAEAVDGRLEGAQFGTFRVVSAALDFDYGDKIHEARGLMAAPAADEPGDDVDAALGRVVEALELFGPTREHVKTLYFQWALIDLSRSVLYAAVPALAVATGMTLYAGDPGSIPGVTLGVDNLVWAVSGAAAVALLPFVVLFAYMLRIATVAKRTLAVGPFVLRETDAAGEER